MKPLLIIAASVIAMSPVSFGQIKSKNRDASNTARKYRAVVGQKEAVFTFPITRERLYQWCPGGLQYAWHVEVKNNSQSFDFGYYVFTPMGATPCGKGDFQDLLKAGQFSIMKGPGDVLRSIVEAVTIGGFTSDNGDELTIKVSGEKAIRLLFSGKPRSCIFATKILDKEYSTRVSLVYDSPTSQNGLAEKKRTEKTATSPTREQSGSNSGDDTVSAAHPSFSPDGSKIAYIQFRHDEQRNQFYEHRLCIADLIGGSVFCFPDAYKTLSVPTFSPDGRQVVFVVYQSDCVSVFISSLDATNIRRLSSCGTHPTWPLFSPNGKYVAFRDILNNRINVIDLEGHLVSRLPAHPKEAIQRSAVAENTRGFAFSPNGKQVVYVSNSRITDSNSIYLEDLGDHSRKIIAELQKETFGYSQVGTSIGISPDGKTVAFTMPIGPPNPAFRPFNEYDPEQYKIFTTVPGLGTRVRLTAGGTLDTDPVFTPDGRQIVFASIEKGHKDGGGIYAMDTSGNNRRLVTRVKHLTPTTAGIGFSVSPDGKTIAYEDSLSPNHYDLLIVNIDGTGRTRLTDLMASKSTESAPKSEIRNEPNALSGRSHKQPGSTDDARRPFGSQRAREPNSQNIRRVDFLNRP